MAFIASVLVALAVSPAPPPIAFGRSGGNIRPYTVSIAVDGHVTATGVTVGRAAVAPATLTSVRRLATSASFAAMPRLTLCAGALPDLAAPWIRIGAHRVAVRGPCRPGFSRLYAALTHAVALGQ